MRPLASRRLPPIAKCIVAEPNHIGAARALKLLGEYVEQKHAGFDKVRIDYRAEFAEAIRLEAFSTPGDGHSELARRRAHIQRPLPARTISTIHKARRSRFKALSLVKSSYRHANS